MTNANHATETNTRSGARRLGDEYQDMIALEMLVDWLEHPEVYEWVRIEADEFGFLDDVVALHRDGGLVVKQVKFSNHPERPNDPWRWQDLLKQPPSQSNRTTQSLLEKWSSSLADLRQTYYVHEASVVSNRYASPELALALSSDGIVDIDRIESADTRAKIEDQLGGQAQARDFFVGFHFQLNEPSLDGLGEGLRRRFYRLGGDEHGWLNLKDELRFWVTH